MVLLSQNHLIPRLGTTTWLRIGFLSSCLFKGVKTSWWLTGEGTLYVSLGFYVRGNALSEQFKENQNTTKAKVKTKCSISSIVMVDASGSANVTCPLPDQVLHRELGCSFPQTHVSDPRRQCCSLCTNTRRLVLEQNFWSLMRGYPLPNTQQEHMQLLNSQCSPEQVLMHERVKENIKRGGRRGRKKGKERSDHLQQGSGCVSIPKCLQCKEQSCGQGDFGGRSAPWHQD